MDPEIVFKSILFLYKSSKNSRWPQLQTFAVPQLTAATQHCHICPGLIPGVNGHVGQVTGGHVSMQRCQTGLKSDGWIDKGWMDTYTRPDRSLSSEAARGHSTQRWLCRRINEKRMMTHFTTSPHTNQEEHCVNHWPLRGNMSPDDQRIMIYWSLQKISPTQSSSEPLPFAVIPRLNQLVDDMFFLCCCR